jgi:hypothetical protein
MSKKRNSTDRTTPRRGRIQLGDRDLKILRHVARFRMTTQQAVHVKFFAGKHRDAVKSTLRRLCGPHLDLSSKSRPRTGYLQSEQLDARRVYYRLTDRATKLLGVSKDLARPMGIQARIHRYAILWFLCIDRSGTRVPLNPRDFPDSFPACPDRLSRSDFYIEDKKKGETRLGLIIVDSGRHRIRVFRNTANALDRVLSRGWLDDFIASRCFDLTVLTLTKTARRGIELGLQDYLRRVLDAQLSRFSTRPDETLPFSIRIRVVPGLIDVVPDAPFKKG